MSMPTPLRVSGRQRIVVLLLWLLVVGATLAQIVRTPFTADLSAFLPASPDAQQRLLIEQLKAGLPARTLMLGIGGASAPERAAASRALATTLRDSGLFEQVQNGQTDSWAGIGQWMVEHRYLLSPAVQPARFSADGLRDAIDDTLSQLGTPAGNALKALLDRDPTGETQRIGESLLPSAGPRTEDGVWVSRRQPRAVLLAIVKAPGADLDAQAVALARTEQAFAPWAAKGLTLQLTGTPRFAVDSRASIEHEARWLAITGSLLMCSLLLLAFASPRALLVAALPVVTGVLIGITAVSLGFGGVHGMTLGFGATLIGEAVDYAIYYLIQARSTAGHGSGWVHWLATGWPTVRLGLLTSVCGFAALVFSGFPGLQQLGVFSLAGLLGAAATTRFVLPVLMPDGASGVGLRRHLGRLAGRLVTVLPATRGLWLLLGAAALVLIVQRGEVWRADLSALSPVPAAQLALDAELRADISSSDGGALAVVQGPDAETTLQRAELASARLEALLGQFERAQAAGFGGFDSITRLLPSQATQARRRASLPAADALRDALAAATQGGPLRAARLAPFQQDVEAARQQPLIDPATVAGTAIGPLASALLQQRPDGSWAALLPLQALKAADGSARSLDLAVLQQALAGVPGAQVIDIGQELGRLYARYLGEAKTQALLGALGVVLLIALALRNVARVLAVCQPLLLAVVLTLGGLVASGVPLGILHLVGLLLVVAVGSNYALFFDLPRQGDAAEDDTMASLLLANLTTVLSFGLIAMSAIPALSAIGVVVAPGALLALLLAGAFARRRESASAM